MAQVLGTTDLGNGFVRAAIEHGFSGKIHTYVLHKNNATPRAYHVTIRARDQFYFLLSQRPPRQIQASATLREQFSTVTPSLDYASRGKPLMKVEALKTRYLEVVRAGASNDNPIEEYL